MAAVIYFYYLEGPVMTNKTDKSPEKQARKVVTFTKSHGRYVRGDVAGFSEEQAEKLIARKVAVAGTKLPAAQE
jgi:hypothetical protein